MASIKLSQEEVVSNIVIYCYISVVTIISWRLRVIKNRIQISTSTFMIILTILICFVMVPRECYTVRRRQDVKTAVN